MKRYSKVVAVLTLLVFAAVSGSAMAQHGGHGGYGHGGGYSHGGGHGHGGGWGYGVGLGLALGLPLLWSGYYAPYPYPAPAYAYPAPAYSYPAPAYAYPGSAVAPSGAYAEQGYAQAAPAPAPAPQQDWYFCAGSNAYYPYVRECPSGWQRVPSQPQR